MLLRILFAAVVTTSAISISAQQTDPESAADKAKTTQPVETVPESDVANDVHGNGRSVQAESEDQSNPSTGENARSDGNAGETASQVYAEDNASPRRPVDGFTFRNVIDTARQRASKDYRKRRIPFKGNFAELDYNQYRDIRFIADRSPWADSATPFRLDVLPPGFLFDRPVNVNLIKNGQATPLNYSNNLFEFGPLVEPPDNPEALAFSGFRIRSPINDPDVMDEVAVFQGASYFRAVAKDQLYGLSARGLAIQTTSDKGEEFPSFTEFWVEEPNKTDREVVVFALLDSESISGAYRFTIQPGVETIMDVESVLFPRRDLSNVGISPLTSMFLFDQTNRSVFDDYRDAVHDSNGLQIITGGGERIWRSLANPAELQISSFVDDNPIGFGLVQRTRNFSDFEDAEALYERRPSVWVEPGDNWGEGAVELLEIPTDLEIHDNIAALWRPKAQWKAGQRYNFGYRLFWTDAPADSQPLLRVDDARIGRRAGQPGVVEVVLDFAGEPPAEDDLSAIVKASTGEVRNISVRPFVDKDHYRVQFEFIPDDGELSEWRLQLKQGDQVASETWLYRWTRRS